jgi:hypothetical protein
LIDSAIAVDEKNLWFGIISLSAGITLFFNLNSVQYGTTFAITILYEIFTSIMIFGGLILLVLNSIEKADAKTVQVQNNRAANFTHLNPAISIFVSVTGIVSWINFTALFPNFYSFEFRSPRIYPNIVQFLAPVLFEFIAVLLIFGGGVYLIKSLKLQKPKTLWATFALCALVVTFLFCFPGGVG